MIAIAAVSKNWVMADKDVPLGLPWKETEDLKFFKEMTIGKKLVCSPKTFQSIKHLKNRKFFLYYKITKNSKDTYFPEIEGYMPQATIANAYKNVSDDYFVAGGRFAYEGLISDCNKLYLTVFDFEVIVENPLLFPYDEGSLLEMGFSKKEFRKLTNGTIYEFCKNDS